MTVSASRAVRTLAIACLIITCLLLSACTASTVRGLGDDNTAKINTDDLKIEIFHSMCRGECPVYSVEIFGDGRIVFIGKQYTSTTGRAEDQLKQSQMEALAHRIYTFGFFDQKKEDFCVMVRLDAPSTFLTIRWAKLERATETCVDNNFKWGSEPVTKLTAEIEAIVNTNRWVIGR